MHYLKYVFVFSILCLNSGAETPASKSNDVIKIKVEAPNRKIRYIKIFTPPKQATSFTSFASETAKLTNSLKQSASKKAVAALPNETNQAEQLKVVEQYEDWTLKYLGEDDRVEYDRFAVGISATKIGRLLGMYHALNVMPSKKKSPGSDGLKSKILEILVGNSDTTLFEINLTLDETVKNLSNTERSFMDIVEKLEVSKSDKIAYFSKVIVRPMDYKENTFLPTQMKGYQLVTQAIEKLRENYLYEDVSELLKQFMAANKNDKLSKDRAETLVKLNFPQYKN
tara:strand:- start:8902 stop:9750 length:849 start_codon:yes stop_codon:yes gene_type:complete